MKLSAIPIMDVDPGTGHYYSDLRVTFMIEGNAKFYFDTDSNC